MSGQRAAAGRRARSRPHPARPPGGEKVPPASAGGWWERAAGLVAGGILLIVGLGYDDAVYAMYFTPRVVVVYPLALLMVLVWLLRHRPGARPLPVDWLDIVAFAFVVWQVISTLLAPNRNLAWYGVLNRGGGAMLWITAALLLVAARRVLAVRAALVPLALCCSLLLSLAGLMTLLQVLGVDIPWRGVGTYLAQRRMTGTAGNPVNLAGLVLTTLWVGGLALVRGDLGRHVVAMLAFSSVLGLTALVCAVSRAGYLAWGLGALVLLVALLLAGEGKRAGVAVGLILVVAACAVLYNPRGEEMVPVATTAEQETGGGGVAALSQSDQSRVEFWRIGLEATRTRPLTGYGQGAYVVAYREHVSAATIADRPNVAVSDPHQLELLLASGSGLPGLLLGLTLLLAPVAVTARRFWVGGRAGPSPPPAKAPDGGAPTEAPRRFLSVVPGVAYAVAAVAFLQVSPLDPVVLLPLVVVSGSFLGAPSGGRLTWTVPARRETRMVWPAASLGIVAFLVLAVAAGVRFYAADTAFASSIRGEGSDAAVEAFSLAPNVPEYAQVAGGSLWREGIAAGDDGRVQEAAAILQRGLRADPQSITVYAELSRLHSAAGRAADAAAACRQGLRFSPHYPILQGLWAYAGLVAEQAGDGAEAGAIAEALAALPVDTADGWYWLGLLQQQLGQSEAAAGSLARAQTLSPALSTEDYQRRLESGS